MKRWIRGVILNSVVVFLTTLLVPGLSYSNDYKVLILAAIALGLVNLFVRPIVKLVTLPINLVTLGVFSWLINVLMLYMVTQIIPGFSVSSFEFSGFVYQGFIIPAMSASLFWAYVISSFVIGLFSSILNWLFD